MLDWVENEPELDASRIGVFGVSLGAMDAVMLTALDGRVNSLVIAMAGGDLSYLLANTNYRRVVRTIDDLAASLGTSREALGAKLDAEIELDPLALAPYVDAERVLMIITRTDAIIPFEAQQQLRTGMGSPETHVPHDRPQDLGGVLPRKCAVQRSSSSSGISLQQHIALAMH